MPDATQRFSSRVDNYVRFRPGYPAGVLDILRQRCGLSPHHRIADVGSGTGIFSEFLLRADLEVWSVEPNGPMRAAAERSLSGWERFHSVDGRAEATTLADASMDFITAAQAAHWFDLAATRPEFVRILKPHGWVVLVWNSRQLDSTPFLLDYEKLLRTHGTDYEKVVEPRGDLAPLQAFFAPQTVETAQVPSFQALDWESLQGRVESASYTPEPGTSAHAAMLADLRGIYERHQQDGQVRILYDTQLFFGHLR